MYLLREQPLLRSMTIPGLQLHVSAGASDP